MSGKCVHICLTVKFTSGYMCSTHFIPSGAETRNFRITGSIPTLLIPWLLGSPGQQQPGYWPCRLNGAFSYMTKDLSYLCHLSVDKCSAKQILAKRLGKLVFIWSLIANMWNWRPYLYIFSIITKKLTSWYSNLQLHFAIIQHSMLVFNMIMWTFMIPSNL